MIVDGVRLLAEDYRQAMSRQVYSTVTGYGTSDCLVGTGFVVFAAYSSRCKIFPDSAQYP